MAVSKIQEQQSGGSSERESPELTRLTVNLVPMAVRALDELREMSGDSKTDCVNRSLRFNAALLRILEDGGKIYVKREGEEDLERIILI